MPVQIYSASSLKTKQKNNKERSTTLRCRPTAVCVCVYQATASSHHVFGVLGQCSTLYLSRDSVRGSPFARVKGEKAALLYTEHVLRANSARQLCMCVCVYVCETGVFLILRI